MSSITPSALNRLHELAQQRAQQLRREAIDDFWRGADAAWASTLSGARRSAQRLAHSLVRHDRTRPNPCPAGSPAPRQEG